MSIFVLVSDLVLFLVLGTSLCLEVLNRFVRTSLTLRRRRNQQESNPPSPEPEFDEHEVEEEEVPTAQIFEEVPTMAAETRTIKELSASGVDNALPLCIQYPTAAQREDRGIRVKIKLVASHSKVPWAVHGRSEQALEGI